VFISGAGTCYHATPYCPILKAGQMKALERGHVGTRIVYVSMIEAKERRRQSRLAHIGELMDISRYR